MFARPEANRHHRQIASSGPAWGQRTDILIVVIGMVLTARFVAPFSLFTLFLFLSSQFTNTCCIWYATGQYCVALLFYLASVIFFIHAGLLFFRLHTTLGVSFLVDYLKKLPLQTGF